MTSPQIIMAARFLRRFRRSSTSKVKFSNTYCCVCEQVCTVSYQARISCAKTLIELEKYDVRFITVFVFGYPDTPF